MSAMTEKNYVEVDSAGGAPIRAWVKGVPFEAEAQKQLRNAAQKGLVEIVHTLHQVVCVKG